MPDSVLVDVIADERFIAYRPKLNAITDSVTATILLQQILQRWYKNGKKPFFKFRLPCKHKLYREGDSWTEELGFSEKEFDTALGKIGTKITSGITREEIIRTEMATSLVIYWTDSSRVTFYEINEALLAKCLFGIYQVNAESAFTLKLPKEQLPYIRDNTEITTDIIDQQPAKRATKKPKPPKQRALLDVLSLDVETQAGKFLFDEAKRLARLVGKLGPQMNVWPDAMFKEKFEATEARIGPEAMIRRIEAASRNIGYAAIKNVVNYVCSPNWDKPGRTQGNEATMQMLESKLNVELVKIYGNGVGA